MEYLDLYDNLTDEDINLKKAAHQFARDVMRPIARKLDTMTAEEVVAADSPLWDFLKQAYEQGYHCRSLPVEMGGAGLTPIQSHLVTEELAWGSFGLSIHLGVAFMPFAMVSMAAGLTGNMELVEKYVKPFAECKDASMLGCWAITEPDHGSDIGGAGQEFFHDPAGRWNVRAKLEGGEWVINGQKAAWVSGATVATHALLFAQVDQSRGMAGGGIFICPLNIEGVTRGKPLEKLGQRDLNQGEIYFDNARIPQNHLLLGPELFNYSLESLLAAANSSMGSSAVGLARAAFEEAFAYAKVRVQGGKPIIEHTSVRQRLFKMFARVETCRALSRSVSLSTKTAGALEYGAASKTTCTRLAYEVTDEAIQILGGNGLAREYLTEKLYRDARATLIEDGNNEMLEWVGGRILQETYPRS